MKSSTSDAFQISTATTEQLEMAMIVGGSAAGAVLLAIIVVGILLCREKKNKGNYITRKKCILTLGFDDEVNLNVSVSKN